MILDNVNRSLELVLGAAVATQAKCTVGYKDIDQSTQELVNVGVQSAQSNDTTPVTILSAPTSGVSRVVSYVAIKVSVETDVVVNLNDNTTLYPQVEETLQADQTLGFTDTGNWQTINADRLTAAVVKALYESNADTNAFTDADESNLDGLVADSPRASLTADETWYVNATTGSDTYDGLSPTDDGGGVGPFATIQKAIDTVASYDLGLFDATINVADGTYTGAIVLKTLVGAGTCFIVGNTATLGNVLIDSTSNNAIEGINYQGTYDIRGLKIQTTGNYSIWQQGLTSQLYVGAIDFGAAGSAHLICFNSFVQIDDDYTISAGSARHLRSVEVADVRINGNIVITASGSPNFSGEVFQVGRQAVMHFPPGTTVSGTITGKRFDISEGSGISFYGITARNTEFLPGDSAGTIDGSSFYHQITATSETGITASTTQTQAGATALTATMNAIGTVANPNDSVRLPAAFQSRDLYIINNGANNVEVWPASGDHIEGAAVDAADPNVLAPDSSRQYKAIDGAQWMRVL